MQDATPAARLFLLSPMDAAGEERLRQVRAHIRCAFGPAGRGRRTKRALELSSAAPPPAKTPRTKLRQRIHQASQLSADQIFSQHFGRRDAIRLDSSDVALLRPAGRRAGAAEAVAAAAAATSAEVVAAATAAAGRPWARPSGIRSPRKALVKRGRSGESSDEQARVLRKLRLGGDAVAQPRGEPRRALATAVAPVQAAAYVPFALKSPSKFQFSSSATRLFTQRQAPLR
ncbi:unnamed protein product [Hyaloperonospora brassicae]|uniref:Uncharacterized protein n=1 Tax=Hyaloperonospora brassicae TaxID=162125 RepID=A0AAV0TS95_HYABA|nr:unnamed protein product [Hyaloperonospora brassicae]